MKSLKTPTPKNLIATIKSSKARAKIAGITDIAFRSHDVAFSGAGSAWTAATLDVDTPAGWQTATCQVAGFGIAYVGSDQNILQVGAFAGIALIANNRLRITVQAILRDNDAAETRAGTVRVQIFYRI